MTDPLVGRVLRGRYRIERRLGQGGMGVVYAAVHLELARPVAVKTLTDVVDRTDIDRFRTEALAAASLAHPHIIQVTDFAAPKGDEPAFLVMELLTGKSLAELHLRGALSRATAIHIALQILDAIGAAHAARILHRDIKPANVFVLDGADAERPWIKVLDFGVAKMMDDGSRLTATGTMIGTPAYMAPEQILGERASEATDLYAIGVCLYEMLAGARPFANKTGPDLTTAILKGAPALSGIDADLAAVVRRSMDRDPKKRFANAADFAAALRTAAKPATDPPAKPRWPLFVAVTCATAAAGIAALVVMTRPPPTVAPKTDDAAIEATSLVVDASDAEALPVSVPVTSPSTSTSASTSTSTSVLSVCSEGNFALCTRAHWECECRTGDGFVVYDQPEQDRGTYSSHPPDGKTEGTTCRGWMHGTLKGEYQADPTHGTWKCRASCNATDIRADRKMAVPGTACTGFLGEKTVQGKWRAWKDP